MKLERTKTHCKKVILRSFASIAILSTLLVGKPSYAAVNVFNHSETAQPGDIFYAQGNWGSNLQVRGLLIDGSTAPNAANGTNLPIIRSNAGGNGSYVSAQIPKTAPLGLYAIWLNDGSGWTSNPTFYLNQAHGTHSQDSQVLSGLKFAVFGRNLTLSGYTPTVAFYDTTSHTTTNGTVISSGSTSNLLWVSAPSTLTVGHTFNIIINNGAGGTYGNGTVGESVTFPWASTVAAPSTTLNGSSVAWNLNVSWQADYTPFSNRVFNATQSPYNVHSGGFTTEAQAQANAQGLQSAITAASQAGGGVVYLPSGTYAIDHYNTNTAMVNLASKVVLMGDGPSNTIISYGHDPNNTANAFHRNVSTTGLLNLGFVNAIDSAGKQLITGSGTEFFIQNCNLNMGTAPSFDASDTSHLLVQNSTIIESGYNTGQFVFHSSQYAVFAGNTISYNRCRNWAGPGGGIGDLFVYNNHITRTASVGSTFGYEAGAFDMYGYHVVFANNTFDIGTDPNATQTIIDSAPNVHGQDGEQILGEYTGGTANDYGTVTSSSSTTLTDSSKNWSSSLANTYPWTGPLINTNATVVSIVSGPGAGQWRYITGSTANTITVGQPWTVAPTSGSHYNVKGWTANQWLITNNSFSDNTHAIAFNGPSTDCVVTNNTLTNDGDINAGAAQDGTNLSLVWVMQWYNNTLVDTNGHWPAGVQMILDITTNAPTTMGVGILGYEARRNSIQATNPPTWAYGQQNQWFTVPIENYITGAFQERNPANGNFLRPCLPPQDVTHSAVLGSILQGNTAINAQDAYVIGGGGFSTVIADPTNVNTHDLVYDQPGLNSTVPAVASTIDYQCENGTLTGTYTSVGTDWSASGGKYVGGLNTTGSSCTLTNVDGGTGGTYNLTITYADPTAASENLYLNGSLVGTVNFPATSGWGGSLAVWQTVSVPITLNAGTANSIKLQRDASNTPINVDKITISNEHPANGWYRLSPGINTGSSLEIQSGGTADQTPIQEDANSTNNSQKWYLTDTGTGWYRLTPATNLNSCMDVQNGTVANSTPVWEYTYNGNTAQLWSFQSLTDNGYRLSTQLNTNYALDVRNGNTGNGTIIQIYSWNDTLSQHWFLTPVTAP